MAGNLIIKYEYKIKKGLIRMLKRIAILSLLAVASIQPLAIAASDEQEIRLEETVITATGFDDTQSNQIKNITVITNEDIQNRGYNTVEDILRHAPGVQVQQTGHGSAIDLRGQGKIGTANLTKGVSNVKILIDGGAAMDTLDISHAYIPLNTISVNDIERIEIINGGGTVLYGSGTRGGVINIITKRRTKEGASGKAYYQNGSYGTNKLGFDTGINFNNNFVIDFGYENLNGKGYRTGEKNSDEYVKGGLTFNIGENQALKFKTSRYNGDFLIAGDFLTEAEMAADRRQTSNLTDVSIKRTEYSLGYDLKAADNLKFSALGYKQRLVRETEGGTGLFKDDKKGVNLKGNYDYGLGNVIFGYEYADNRLLRSSEGMYPAGPGTTISNDIKINLKKEVNSVFVLNRHSITDNWETTLGYRYEKAKYDIKRRNVLDMIARGRKINMSTNNIDFDRKESNSAYEGGVNYKYSDTGNVYVKYERGFRSPGATELIDNRVITIPGSARGISRYSVNDMKSEKYNTYEIGLKDMIGNSFVSATLFYTDTKDEIHINMPGHGLATSTGWTYENLKKTERKGIELFAEQYLGKFRINESLSYVNAEIKDVNSGSMYEKGQKVPYVSPVKATLGVNYEAVPGLTLSGHINYNSSYRDNAGKKSKGYSTADLGVKYDHSSGLGIQAGVKNLFDTKYNENQSTSGSTTTYTPARERTYYLGVSYDF